MYQHETSAVAHIGRFGNLITNIQLKNADVPITIVKARPCDKITFPRNGHLGLPLTDLWRTKPDSEEGVGRQERFGVVGGRHGGDDVGGVLPVVGNFQIRSPIHTVRILHAEADDRNGHRAV